MANELLESDWKHFRSLHNVALERFCERILSEVREILDGEKKSAHERYLAVFDLIDKRNDELAEAFNDVRRSTAIRQLVAIQWHNLLTDQELAGFSTALRERIEKILDGLRNG